MDYLTWRGWARCDQNMDWSGCKSAAAPLHADVLSHLSGSSAIHPSAASDERYCLTFSGYTVRSTFYLKFWFFSQDEGLDMIFHLKNYWRRVSITGRRVQTNDLISLKRTGYDSLIIWAATTQDSNDQKVTTSSPGPLSVQKSRGQVKTLSTLSLQNFKSNAPKFNLPNNRPAIHFIHFQLLKWLYLTLSCSKLMKNWPYLTKCEANVRIL